MRPILASFLLLSFWRAALGQFTMPIPEELKKLESLNGSWVGTMKMKMPGQTEEMEVPTTVETKFYGQYQETIYVMNMGAEMKYSGHIFLTWDSGAKHYKSWGFDDSVGEPRTETGSFDGKKLIMTSAPQGGMISRTTYEIKSKDEVNFTIELKNGDKFEKMGEVVFKRKA